MREMTTAEFAKANLAALEEPVTIRRYTKTVGTYYPEGYEPAAPPPQPTLGLDDVAPASVKATAKIVEDLTEEVARLKRELAARPVIQVPEVMRAQPAALAVIDRKRVKSDDDPFVGLAKQDREFFERKLGTKRK